MFYIRKLSNDKYAIMKHYPNGVEGSYEQWKIASTYEDAVQLCHYMNGGTDREYFKAQYRVYEWKLVPMM